LLLLAGNGAVGVVDGVVGVAQSVVLGGDEGL
jgi:hypothetical protein